ncbi:cyclin-dependent kinase 5 [Vigna unguiculata]|uniref:Cyclin-dependent kinase 5 n=1 Tax=Vigna unguiculata TaxID=3917 RepID=A0A4D6LBR6_VIGUN|nr:cyclin-dependent kinase 5 [Vigna unguiculata]
MVAILWWSRMARLALCSICSHDKSDGSDAGIPDLEILEVVADGGYGRVYQGFEPSTGEIVAMKQIVIIGSRQGVPSAIIREVAFLKELRHDNIVRLLRVYVRRHRYVNLVFERLPCDLHDYIRRRTHRNMLAIKSFMYQILSALEFCHARQVLHRDLKPSNVLIDQASMLVKLADFGLAREFRNDILYTDQLGTAAYRAPEMLCDNYQYSSPIDVWAAGCVFAEMITGLPLFQNRKLRDELEAIFRLTGTPTEETWPGITELMPDIHKYQGHEPVGIRTLFPELERSGQDLLSRMLCLNPNERISASAALNHPYFTEEEWLWDGKPWEESARCIPFR